jgi:hypothetical protein
MNKKIIIYLSLILFIQSISRAQIPKSWKAKPFDTSYIQTYPKVFTLYLPVTTPYLSFIYKEKGKGNYADFRPARQLDLGLGLNYHGFNLIIGTGIAFFKNNKLEQGKTKYLDLQVHFMPRRFANDLYYQKYKGYYIRNSDSFINNQTNIKLLRPDIKTELIALNSIYIFNYRQFSFKSAFNYNETQIKDAGSVLLGVFYSRFKESGDSALIIPKMNNYLNSGTDIQQAVEQITGLNMGYAHTFIAFRDYRATIMVMEGFGIYKIHYTKLDRTIQDVKPSVAEKTNLRFSAGYDSGKIIIGLFSIYDFYHLYHKNNDVVNFENGKLRIYAGYRFGKKNLKRINTNRS